MNARMTLLEWSLVVLLAAIWSFSYLFNRVALDDLPVVTVVLGRVGIGALALAFYLRFRRVALPRGGGVWAGLFLLALLNNVFPFLLIVGGQTRIDSGLAAILLGVSPLVSLILSRLVGGEERMTPARIGGLALGLVGLAVLVGPAALSGLGGDLLGQVMVLGAATSYAAAALYGRRFRGHDPYAVATGQLLCSTAVVLPLAAIVDAPWTLSPGWLAWGAILGIALLATSVAYVLYFRILATAGATNLLLVTLLVPPGAVLWGTLLLGERIAWTGLVGMALIILGLVVLDGRAGERLRRAVGRLTVDAKRAPQGAPARQFLGRNIRQAAEPPLQIVLYLPFEIRSRTTI